MFVFIVAVGFLSVTTNRSLRQIVSLRLRTEQMADDLRRQKEIAEQASLAKSKFLAAASHDLRQPVHALGLFVGALRGVEMSAEGQRLVEQIEASTTAMDGLFSALLEFPAWMPESSRCIGGRSQSRHSSRASAAIMPRRRMPRASASPGSDVEPWSIPILC